jgi:hypothetical protein
MSLVGEMNQRRDGNCVTGNMSSILVGSAVRSRFAERRCQLQTDSSDTNHHDDTKSTCLM